MKKLLIILLFPTFCFGQQMSEIVKQLRIRDIGGLIVIDFIDFQDIKNRKKVYEDI